MNALAITLTLFLAIAPLVNVGGSVLLSWLVTLVIIAVIVWFIVWIVTKFAGPPSIPEGARWIIWVIVAIALLLFLFSALGLRIP